MIKLNAFFDDQELKDFIREAIKEVLTEELLSLRPIEKKEREEEVVFTIAELAKYLKCSLPTIHAMKKEGLIPFYRLGRKVYFKKSEIDEAANTSIPKKKKRF